MSHHSGVSSLLSAAESEKLPPEIVAAYRDAKSRGLPDGWTCTIDKRKRRKWTAPAPSTRSCDSIPKALAISVELGLLPPDTKIVSGKRKRPPQKGPSRPLKRPAAAKSSTPDSKAPPEEEEDGFEEEQDDEPDDDEILARGAPEPLDPETSLDPKSHRTAAPSTVHWDPHSREGNKVGWRVRVATTGSNWVDGRVVRYDPYTHKHKVELTNSKKNSSAWIWLRNEEHNLQIATRIVWAKVKGYAWWPALIFESNNPEERRDGYVLVEFFGSGEVSTLRDTSDFVRPFQPDEIDPVVAKHKKKRNANAFTMACEEFYSIRAARNDAAVFYAERSVDMAQLVGKHLIGKRIQIHRSDVNYPYGDTVVAKVRAYSSAQKKWLLSYEFSDKTKTKYEASWLDVYGKKECSDLKVLDKGPVDMQLEDLLPYLVGFDFDEHHEQNGSHTPNFARDLELYNLLKKRCQGCVEYWKNEEIRVDCDDCGAECHMGCLDPPLTLEAWQKMVKDDASYQCARCKPCRGCYQKDATFGSHPRQCPPMLSFPKGESLDLCQMCCACYDSGCFCPNCAHSWDAEKYEKVTKNIEYTGALFRKRKLSGGPLVDSTLPPVLGSFTGDDELPLGAKIDPTFFYPETTEWGYGENDMLVCDNCDVWVHAGCSGLSEDEYDQTSDGKHPIYSKEFLCRVCCRERCKDLISALQEHDTSMLFAVPVTEKVAPNYRDIIKHPMDLQTMQEKAENEEYVNYAWVRELFELMVLNALMFNRYYTPVWNEAERYYHICLQKVFGSKGKGAPSGKYAKDIAANFKKAEEAHQMEVDRVQVDESVEKKDLVAGSMAASVSLPKLRDSPPDQSSCVPFAEVKLKPTDAFYCSWMECCFTCGSSGAMDTMLFCVDCGEGFHSFCVNAPVHSMDQFSVSGWRCPNCKICEICGDVPQDETRMLFCEMCDRGFSLDLLDPPLAAAPPGLWICGQCVDCRDCRNTAEKDGTSLKHWSRDPEKCFRCGGCDGLVDDYMGNEKCMVCTKFLRTSDAGVVKCAKCSGSIHAACHHTAKEHLVKLSRKPRIEFLQSMNSYHCPDCAPKSATDSGEVYVDRSFLANQAWTIINQDSCPPHENFTETELFSKVMDEVDWQVRELGRESYLSVIREGLRIYSLAKLSFGDPRIVSQHALSGPGDLPMYLIQRALRFVFLVRRSQWEKEDPSTSSIQQIVPAAKLAAAFLKVSCVVLTVDIAPAVKSSDLLSNLLHAADECGHYVHKRDSIRTTPALEEIARGVVQDAPVDEKEAETSEPASADPVALASPLCGWTTGLGGAKCPWKDPRECCLCHLCGDDDAGVDVNPKSKAFEVIETHLGRLLPMPDGSFVHTACALWSSEVWEDASDGLIHAVEKAKSRGAQLKCFGCGFYGATVGCNKSNCLFNYHFPCAKACGAVFTSDQHVYCSSHKSSATGVLPKESVEHMKTLMVNPEKKAGADKEAFESGEDDSFSRVGALTVHSLGEIKSNVDGFHSEHYITPAGYVATRVFWSTVEPKKRTVYVLRIEEDGPGGAMFTILPGDSANTKIRGPSVGQVYNTLLDRVRKANADYFSHGNLLSKLPAVRRTRRKTFGLNGPQFFGFGLDFIRKRLEATPGVEAVAAPLSDSSPKYRFCFQLPSIEAVKDVVRKRAAAKAERALENSSGCARVEGMKAVATSGGSGRITRALVRSAEEEPLEAGSALSKKGDEKAKADRSLSQVKYRKMKAVPMEQRLAARRSHIHGWGLFTKVDIAKNDPIVEYMGETIRQPIADIRERAYEISGEGSCYMFRLDLQRIVDATMIGCMARFMNHSCQPNAYAKIIAVDTETGQERKIVVFANRDIAAGEEITYDYKFPVEDGSLRCTCGAPNCIGRLN